MHHRPLVCSKQIHYLEVNENAELATKYILKDLSVTFFFEDGQMMRGLLSKISIALQVNNSNQAIFFRVHHSRLDSMFLVKVWEEFWSSKSKRCIRIDRWAKGFSSFLPLGSLCFWRPQHSRRILIEQRKRNKAKFIQIQWSGNYSFEPSVT